MSNNVIRKRRQTSFTCIFQAQYRPGNCRGTGRKLRRLIYWSSIRWKTPCSVMWLEDFLWWFFFFWQGGAGAFQHVWIDHVSTVPQISTSYIPEAEEVFASDKVDYVDLSSFQLALRPVFFLLKFESAITADLRVRKKHSASQISSF